MTPSTRIRGATPASASCQSSISSTLPSFPQWTSVAGPLYGTGLAWRGRCAVGSGARQSTSPASATHRPRCASGALNEAGIEADGGRADLRFQLSMLARMGVGVMAA